MSYPTTLDNLLTAQPVVDGAAGTIYEASWLNVIQGAVDALETKVGVNGSSVATTLDFALKKGYVKVSDVKSSVDGGSAAATTWNVRTLNTEDHDDGNLCTLSSNRITLSAGTYRCRISAPAYDVDQHMAQLWNYTDSVEIIRGTSENPYRQSRSWVVGQFTIGAAKQLQVRHYTNSAKSTTGLGVKTFASDDNVYTIAEFWKIA